MRRKVNTNYVENYYNFIISVYFHLSPFQLNIYIFLAHQAEFLYFIFQMSCLFFWFRAWRLKIKDESVLEIISKEVF